MDPSQELEQLLEAQAIDDARRSLLSFVVYTCPYYDVNWHHRRICEKLEAFLRGECPRLIIMCPPRTGKTELASKRFPAWALGRDPDTTVIATSYGADLAGSINRDVQRIMDTEEYRKTFPDTRLNDANARTVAGNWLRNSDTFEIVGRRGAYVSAGVGGSITGKGGHILIIDDPIKNSEEAHSQTYRDKLWDWYTSTLYTRLASINPKGILLMLTRWHEDDLAGRLLRRAEEDPRADQWDVISFPAAAEHGPTADDPREEGDPLWEGPFPRERLESIRASTTPMVWSALYQQHPSPAEGNIFKRQWWRFWYPKGVTPPPPEIVRVSDQEFVECGQRELPDKLTQHTQSWDMSFKDTKSSDYVSGQVWAEFGADSFLLDQLWGRMDFIATLAAVRALTNKWPMALAKLVEEKANGAAVISSLQREIAGLIPIEPLGGKEARAVAASPAVFAGNVWLPHPAFHPWVRDFIEEHAAFPNGTHDDQVDAETQYLNYRYGTGASRAIGDITLPLDVGYSPSYWSSLGSGGGTPHLSPAHE
jgi:predicted phage terminase large subunit-like protein